MLPCWRRRGLWRARKAPAVAAARPRHGEGQTQVRDGRGGGARERWAKVLTAAFWNGESMEQEEAERTLDE